MLLTAVGFWPGIAVFDTIRQYCQAITHSYSNQHPPIMAAWWALLNCIHDGPELLLLFHLSLYWTALYLLSDSLRRLSLPHAWLAASLGFTPFLMNFSGVLMKDTGLTVVWAFAFSLIFRRCVSGPLRLGIGEAIVVFLCLTYGTLVRHNAIFAVFPLVAFAWAIWYRHAGWRKIAAVTCVTVAVMLAAGALLNRILKVKDLGPTEFLLVYDITGVAVRCGEEVLPDYVRHQPEYTWPAIRDAYTPVGLLPLIVDAKKRESEVHDTAWWADGPTPDTLYGDRWSSRSSEIYAAWIAAVRHHPMAYLEHRLSVFQCFLRLGYIDPRSPCYFQDMSPPGFNWRRASNLASRGLERYITASVQVLPVLFKPYYWLFLAICGCIILWSYHGNPQIRSGAAVLYSSAILYLMPYLLVTPGTDFRYAYWSVWATAIATLMVALDMFARRSLGGSKHTVIGCWIAAAAVLCADTVWYHGWGIPNV